MRQTIMESLNPSQIKKLIHIANKGYSQTLKASQWMIEFSEYNHIGQIINNKWQLDSLDIQLIRDYLKAKGFCKKMFDDAVLEKRGSASQYYDDEKTAHAVTAKRLMIACHSKVTINQDSLPLHRATMVTVDELLELSPSQIVIIENSETFYDIALHVYQIEHLVESDCVFVYRGGPGHSTDAIQGFIQQYRGEVIAFFDYDLAGMSLFNMKGINKLILPDLQQIKELHENTNIKLNQPHLFSNQAPQWFSRVNSLADESPCSLLANYCNYLIKYQFGVTQERLLSNKVTFCVLVNQ